MSVAFAFDIYGTLIDTHGVVDELRKHLGDRAVEFSKIWRDKQLEYTWRRGLMGQYQNFAVCTRQSLDYTDLLLQTDLEPVVKDELLQCYRRLPAFDDVAANLATLAQADCQLFAFSNGLAEDVAGLLKQAGIDHLFDRVVSVDELQTFKPDPKVYQHLLRVTQTPADQCWLVSSNAFDVIGARAVGIKTAWLQRSKATVFDPWEMDPDVVINDLSELLESTGL